MRRRFKPALKENYGLTTADDPVAQAKVRRLLHKQFAEPDLCLLLDMLGLGTDLDTSGVKANT